MAITKYRPCSVDGCEGAVKAREFCNIHWRRWRLYGDPLAGGTQKGALRRFLLTAVETESRQCLIWPFSDAGNGYGKIRHGGKTAFAHRVVCEMVHGPAPSSRHQAAHSCGRGGEGCVNPRHVSWKLPKENNADKIAHGTVNTGAANGMAKLSPSQVQEIRNLRGSLAEVEIAARFGISRAAVNDIHSRRRWASL